MEDEISDSVMGVCFVHEFNKFVSQNNLSIVETGWLQRDRNNGFDPLNLEPVKDQADWFMIGLEKDPMRRVSLN